ncbi:Zn-dependent protease [Sphingomonas sp. Root710]|nr:Zn-dependent protease [Sphingomonas sp. Root710]
MWDGAVGQCVRIAVTALVLMPMPAMAAGPSPFDGIPGVTFEYHDVEGLTAADIYASMKARAPAGASDGGGIAKTAWNLKVGWREVRRGKSCDVSDPLSSLSITVHLPRLINQHEVTPEGLAFWRAAIAGLEIHEAGHARIAWEHRNDFNRAALKASCNSVRKVAEQTQVRIDAIQRAYDRDTKHGITQMPPIEP